MQQYPWKETRLWRLTSASVIVTVATASKIVIGKLEMSCIVVLEIKVLTGIYIVLVKVAV